MEDIMYHLRVRRENQKPILIVIGTMALLYLLYVFGYLSIFNISEVKTEIPNTCHAWDYSHINKQQQKCRYNARYPLSLPKKMTLGKKFPIAIIADLDEERSKVTGEKMKWQSFLKKGFLIKSNDNSYEVEWANRDMLTSRINEKGRGFELSELCVFNGKLYAIDDRTGIVYNIKDGKAVPWVILMDGNGDNEKGFKGEWLTVRDGVLYVGGLGKEWTTKEGDFLNYNPLFVKSIDQFGAVEHHNWTLNYLKIRASVNIHFPGYMIHEAVMWSNHKKRWYFLPRRMSELRYDDAADERRGTNVLISADKNFENIQYIYVGHIEPTHGFSSFKFVPDTEDNVIVALKSKEVEGDIGTYVMVFETDTGKVLMEERFIEKNKYEGIEFI